MSNLGLKKTIELLSNHSDELSMEELAAMHKKIDELSEELKKSKELLEEVMHKKFDKEVEKHLSKDGRLSGRVHFDCWLAEKPKKVIWDQEQLATIAKSISAVNREKMIKVSYTVEERKFSAWDEDTRSMFMPARSIEFGKIRYQLKGEE